MLVAVVGLVAAGCGSDGEPAATAAATQPGFPLTITNCGQELTFDAPPERTVAMDQIVTEVMLGVGLADSMVGTANQFNPIFPAFADDYARVPVLAEAGYPSKEVLLNTSPDFVVGYLEFTTYSGFPAGSNFTRAELTEKGIDTFTLRCDGETETQQLLYERYRELGKIFGASSRAEEFASSVEAGLAATGAVLAGAEPVRAFIYGGGEGPLVTSGGPYEGISFSGGTNLFRDLPEFVGGLPPTVSIEQVIDRDPEAIVIMDWGAARPDAPSVEVSKAFLRERLATTTAVQNNRLCVAEFYDFRGGPRTVEAVGEMARCLHPELGS